MFSQVDHDVRNGAVIIFVPGLPLVIAAVRLHFPNAALVDQLYVDDFPEPFLQRGVFDGGDDLDPFFEIAFHQVGGTDEVFLLAAVLEVVDTGMFEKTADYRDDRNGFRQAFDAGSQPAGVPDDQVDVNPGLGSLVESLGDILVLEGIAFELDETGVVRRVLIDLAGDLFQQRFFQDVR